MVMKYLMVSMTTFRERDGERKRIRFPARSTVDLTAEELETLDRLQKQTGKLHYRDLVNESPRGAPVVEAMANPGVESQGQVVETPNFAGQDTPITKKTVPQLKAYLAFYGVEPKSDAKKDLLAAAQGHAATLATGDADDEKSGEDAEEDLDGGL